ncbi:MAG: DUF2141 domain-containing protein [Brevundimonas sp.]|uniref:DUF2141 domain-containing protein n=1 Tax=Brevundimonas sp. TaxID=1871086 RepID=UPI0030022A19
MLKSLALATTLAVGALALPALSLAQSADVVVTLTGVQDRGGHALASLSTESTFMRGQGEYSARVAVDSPGTLTLTFENVAPGDYALMVMHDANDNGEFDMAPSGMPSEGFAFSSGGAPLMGPPAFSLLKFTVGSEDVTLTESMTYF